MNKGKFKEFFGNKCIRSLEVALGIGFVGVIAGAIIMTMVKGKNNTEIAEGLRDLSQKFGEEDTILKTCEYIANSSHVYMKSFEDADVKDVLVNCTDLEDCNNTFIKGIMIFLNDGSKEVISKRD